MGVNNGYDIGVNGRDLILKTSGKIYVKVAEKFYELDFRNTKQDTQKTESDQSQESKTSDIVFLDTLSKENYPGDNKLIINNDELYITKGGFYTKINVTASSQTEDAVTSYPSDLVVNEVTEDEVVDDTLFIQINDGVWSLGETVSFYDLEFIENPEVKWNNALFFNAAKEYFFDEIEGLDDDDINKLFFNNTTDSLLNWTTKSKTEIEQTVLNHVKKNGKTVAITDFKKLYNSFWYSGTEFESVLSSYLGTYVTFTVDFWTSTLCPKTTISVGGIPAIITAIIDDTIIAKLKNSNTIPNDVNIQKISGSINFCKKDDISFLDVTNLDTVEYDSLQNENDTCIRIGNLNTLQNHSGIGAFFNQNITIKNGPFTLNPDGSGSIGAQLKWNTNGNLSGTYVDSVNNKIASLESQLKSLSSLVEDLTLRVTLLENW